MPESLRICRGISLPVAHLLPPKNWMESPEASARETEDIHSNDQSAASCKLD
jgi:hypothetical protein